VCLFNRNRELSPKTSLDLFGIDHTQKKDREQDREEEKTEEEEREEERNDNKHAPTRKTTHATHHTNAHTRLTPTHMPPHTRAAQTQRQNDPARGAASNYATRAEAVLDSYFQLGGRVFFSL